MNGLPNLLGAILTGLVLALPCNLLADSDRGDRVVKRGQIDDEFYAVGGAIDIDAKVDGDVIVAGGELRLGHRIDGDLIAAGGKLRIRGEVTDDIRISGGDLDIDAVIGDDLAAGGGQVSVSAGSRVGGDAWLFGGEVDMAGTVNRDLLIRGGKIRLSGTVFGDVELDGRDIQILDGARIHGNLSYSSPRAVQPGERVTIGGELTRASIDYEYADSGFGLFFPITLMVAGILLYLLFPRYTLAAVRRIDTDPWTSLGIGFLFLVFTPCLALMAMLIVLGFWIGLSLLALYGVALLTGFLVACFFLAERGARLCRQELASTGRRLIGVTIAIFVLGLAQSIPLFGGILLLVLLLFGLGAALVQLRYVYHPSEAA